jgi:tRNA-specific adenosine deaminase 2
MCASALARLGVSAVYYGCSNEKFGGCGSVGPSLLQDRVSTVRGGIRAEEAVRLLKGFYDQENPFAPCPKVTGVYRTGTS